MLHCTCGRGIVGEKSQDSFGRHHGHETRNEVIAEQQRASQPGQIRFIAYYRIINANYSYLAACGCG